MASSAPSALRTRLIPQHAWITISRVGALRACSFWKEPDDAQAILDRGAVCLAGIVPSLVGTRSSGIDPRHDLRRDIESGAGVPVHLDGGVRAGMVDVLRGARALPVAGQP